MLKKYDDISLSDNINNNLLEKEDDTIYKDILSLTLMIKNEALYIKEWIEFHRMMGVTHFYIYDNDSSDGLYEKLENYIKQGIVTYFYWPTENIFPFNVKTQINAYNHSLKHHKYNTKYMGFIDTDEFIVPVDKKSIVEVIEEVFAMDKNCGGIGINWRVYGSSYKNNKPDGLVIDNYKYRAFDSFDMNKHIKTICNPRVTVGFTTESHSCEYMNSFYCISENGEKINGYFFQNSICNKIRINHYYIKSKEDCIEKCRRKNGTHENEEYIDDFFEQINKDCNEVYDLIMEKYVDELKSRCDLI